MQQTFSLCKINDTTFFDFCPADYSRFKFGDGIIAEKFGNELASKFIEQYLEANPIKNQIVVISSPYSFIPTATFTLKEYFVFTLNQWLANNNYNVVETTKIHRTITYKEDYGELDAEQRMNLIGNDYFHIDKDFLKGKTLLFIDDIKITGSHEKMIKKMILEHGLKNDIHFLYFAELKNKNIHPNIENYLNYFAVKSIFDLTEIINFNRFRINTRIVKYILISDFMSFKLFMENQNTDFISQLYNMALGNNYHTIKEYQKNLNYIKEIFFNKTFKSKYHGN